MKCRKDWKSIPFPSLVQRSLAGDETAFAVLYDETYDYVASAVRRQMDNEADVQDILQETYLLAFQKLDTLKDPFAFPAWVKTIAVHITATQRQSKAPIMLGDLTADSVPKAAAADTTIARNPQQRLDREESCQMVREILDGLTEEHRTVLVLHYVEGVRLREIAELTSCPLGTVKTRLHYARKRFRTEVRTLKKQGIHLYGISPIPAIPALLRLLYGKQRGAKHIARAPGSGASAATSTTAANTGKLLSATALRHLATTAAAVILTGGICITGGMLLRQSSGDMDRLEPQLLLSDSGVPSPTPAEGPSDARTPVPRDGESGNLDAAAVPLTASTEMPFETDSGTGNDNQPASDSAPANGVTAPDETEQADADVTLATDDVPENTAPDAAQSLAPEAPEAREEADNGSTDSPVPSAVVSASDTGSGESGPTVSPSPSESPAAPSPSDTWSVDPTPTAAASPDENSPAPSETPSPADTEPTVVLSSAKQNYAAHVAYQDGIADGSLLSEYTDEYVYSGLAEMTDDGIDELIRSYDIRDDQTVIHNVDFYTCSVTAEPAPADSTEDYSVITTVSYLGTVAFTRTGLTEECHEYDIRKNGNRIAVETLVLDTTTGIWTVTIWDCSISGGSLVTEIVSEASFGERTDAEAAYYAAANDYPELTITMTT